MAVITCEEFKRVLQFMPFVPEFEFYFDNTENTYSLIKYSDKVSFCRCGYSDEMIESGWSSSYRGSKEEIFDNFDELYNATVIDDICLIKDWFHIKTIVVNNTFNIPEQLDELYEVYGDLKANSMGE